LSLGLINIVFFLMLNDWFKLGGIDKSIDLPGYGMLTCSGLNDAFERCKKFYSEREQMRICPIYKELGRNLILIDSKSMLYIKR